MASMAHWRISQSLFILVILLIVIPPKCESNVRSHHHRHRHGWNKHDSVESYKYKPNNRFICEETEDDVLRVHEEAKRHCKCPTIYAPVCGTDDVTYHNRCILTCAAQHQLKYQGFHSRGRRLAVAKLEPCDAPMEDDY